jgi:uncharacterized protein YggE
MSKHSAAVVVFSACLLWNGLAAAQEHPAMSAQANTVYVSAEGKYEAQPDTALLQFNISAQEDSSKAAYDHASRNADQFRQILRAHGVDPKSAEIGYLSVEPVYDWKQPKRKLVGYRVNASTTLKLKDFSKIAPIVQQLADTDLTDNQSLSYTLENIDTAKQKAVEDAYRRANDSAATIARAGGRALGELSYASVDTFEQVRVIANMARGPVPMLAGALRGQAEAAPTAEFSPQTIVVTAHVNALFVLK